MTEQALHEKRDQLMARDLDQIEQVSSYGVDLNRDRKIDLTFWAPDETTARQFAEAATRNEMPPTWVLGPANSEENQRWVVRCSISASVTFVTTKENLVAFLLFADKYNCEYDGWGTAIVEAAKSKSGEN